MTPSRSRRCKAAWSLALILSLPIAGCSWDSGLELLARTVAGTGEAWCRHADNCYPYTIPRRWGTPGRVAPTGCLDRTTPNDPPEPFRRWTDRGLVSWFRSPAHSMCRILEAE